MNPDKIEFNVSKLYQTTDKKLVDQGGLTSFTENGVSM
jgi:hypothetical protein